MIAVEVAVDSWVKFRCSNRVVIDADVISRRSPRQRSKLDMNLNNEFIFIAGNICKTIKRIAL